MTETDKIIELICTQGCKNVNKVRKQIKNGEIITELAAFSSKQQHQIKLELDSIMKPYEDRKKGASAKRHTG